MKNVFKILIYLLAILLAYILYSSIKEPIKFQAAKQARKAVVVKQLEDIRTAQEIYRSITGAVLISSNCFTTTAFLAC